MPITRKSKANGHHLPPNNIQQKHNEGLLPKGFTKAMIGVLILSGVIVVGLQPYIYFNFTQVYDGNSLPSSNYGSSWDVLYTAMAMASGSANALAAFYLACVIRARRRLMMIFGTVFTFVAGAASALAGFYSIAELFKLKNSQEIPQHVCVGADAFEPLKTQCTVWWWLELTVIIFCGFAVIADFACFTILCIDLNGEHYRKKIQPAPADLDFGGVGSITSVSTIPHSMYDDQSTSRSELWIPRINSIQRQNSNRSSSDVMRRHKSEIVQTRTHAKQRIPPSPSQHQNRPSLPIVIRNKTSSIYFY